MIIIFLIILVVLLNNPVHAGWWLPYLGQYRGHWSLNLGTHFWQDHFYFRNLQLRTNLDLAPGLRFHTVIRSNRELASVNKIDPLFDELYLEGYGFREDSRGLLSLNLRIGRMRYLRFPAPDLISGFDPIPGVADLRRPGRTEYPVAETGYRGQLLTIDYHSKLGLGYHFSGINWAWSRNSGQNIINHYLYYKYGSPYFDLELRWGRLQLSHPGGGLPRGSRPYQLGDSGPGYSVYLGVKAFDYKAGLFWEDIFDEEAELRDARIGVIVTFSPSRITEFLGKHRGDYTRSPEGLVMNIPLFQGNPGTVISPASEDDQKLVGEITAKRLITYWQNGQGRNFYEHRISRWGKSGDDYLLVVVEEPWVLRHESLNIPNSSFESWSALVASESSSQRNALITQKVTYQFYQKQIISD